MWERALNWKGPWEPVADSRVPACVVRKYNRWVKRGESVEAVPAYRYYYRFVFCV